jgi:hypothetical protein
LHDERVSTGNLVLIKGGVSTKVESEGHAKWQPDSSAELLSTQRLITLERDTNLAKTIYRRAVLTGFCAMLCSLPTFGVLGEDVSSVNGDRIHANASLRVSQGQNYTVHELRSGTGTVIREYASASGRVFAVAWRGPYLPDMRQLLGSYFEEFQKAAQGQSRRGGHGPLIIQQPGFVVELGGHMRSFAGRAYLPDEMPRDVQNGDIR